MLWNRGPANGRPAVCDSLGMDFHVADNFLVDHFPLSPRWVIQTKDVVQVLGLRDEQGTVTSVVPQLHSPCWVATAPRSYQPVDSYPTAHACAQGTTFNRIEKLLARKRPPTFVLNMSTAAEVWIRSSIRTGGVASAD